MIINTKIPQTLDTEIKMNSVIFVQQHYINKLEEESNRYVKSLGQAIQDQDSENKFGIIVNNILKLLMNNYTTDTEDYTLSNLFSDITYKSENNNIFYNNDNAYELVLFNSLTIDGHEIVTVCCCEDTCIISPKSYDIHGITELQNLHNKLIKTGRVKNKPLEFLCKKCTCT